MEQNLVNRNKKKPRNSKLHKAQVKVTKIKVEKVIRKDLTDSKMMIMRKKKVNLRSLKCR